MLIFFVLLSSLLSTLYIRDVRAFVLVTRSFHAAAISKLSRRHMANTNEGADESLTVVVVGGGWAGFSAADALSTSTANIKVLLLDASPRGPGGLAGGWRTSKLKRPVEAGIHGFWREYRNTFAAMERIGLNLDDVLTPYTPSVLASSSGRVALAPVLGSRDDKDATHSSTSLENIDWSDLQNLPKQVADLLPPPLDVALLAEYDPNSPLTLADRISGLGLLGAWADFGQEDPASWDRYDKISAENLFRSIAAVSPRLYSELVVPLLHVLPMGTGYEISGAAALSCFHVFALQARGAFDVRWCRGSISERIFNPWVETLKNSGKVDVRGGARVTCITENDVAAKRFVVDINESESIACDAVVLAVGATTAGRLYDSCPVFHSIPNLEKQWKELRGVTCVAVRLFLSTKEGRLPRDLEEALEDSPVVVCGPKIGGLQPLVETGFCIYDLGRLQDEFVADEDITALEVDFFRADDIASMKDEQVVELALIAIEAALDVEPITPALVVESAVVRAPKAVSLFFVGSAALSPPVKLEKGLYMCGDWVDRKGHASWSTEKSVVTGRQAVAALSSDFELSCETEVIPAVPDTPQLAALRSVASMLRTVIRGNLFPLAPWALANQLMGERR